MMHSSCKVIIAAGSRAEWKDIISRVYTNSNQQQVKMTEMSWIIHPPKLRGHREGQAKIAFQLY